MERDDYKKLCLEVGTEIQGLSGVNDENLRLIEDKLKVQLLLRNGVLTVSGPSSAVEKAGLAISNLATLVREGKTLSLRDIKMVLRLSEAGEGEAFRRFFSEVIEVSPKKRPVRPRSLGQKRYLDAIHQFDMVLAIGPAGTGKTYLAMAMAVSSLLKKQISRIILTRPAVEAGERLGFLPGTLYEKINPYLRPLYDALYDMMESERVSHLLELGTIEIAPLAFMRGRTLNDSFIILDEAQNTTSEQMKMFLTRLGFSSKAVITGDITQVDLPAGKVSGLIEVQSILKEVEGIEFVYLTEEDVIRHELVQRVIRAYESYQQSTAESRR
jgi:phosphate starvation-inducible protein PhoH and related proteins